MPATSEGVSALLISFVRTIVAPTLFGLVVQALVFLGADPTPDVRAAVTAGLAVIWYLFAKFLGTVNQRFGILLLIAVQPKYVEGDDDGEQQLQSDMLLAVRRSVIPLLAGWAVPALVRLIPAVSWDTATATLALQSGFTAAYYYILRWIEERGKARVAHRELVDGVQALPASAQTAGVLLGGRAALTY